MGATSQFKPPFLPRKKLFKNEKQATRAKAKKIKILKIPISKSHQYFKAQKDNPAWRIYTTFRASLLHLLSSQSAI